MGRVRTGLLVALLGALALAAAPTRASATGPWDYLLASESACPGENDVSLTPGARAQTVVCIYNWARAQQGVAPLVLSRQLRISSARKARDISRCQQFSHDACGRNPFYWVRRAGFLRGSSKAGEILAAGPAAIWTPRETVSQWLNSDEHRSVVLTPSFNEVGVSELTGRLAGRKRTAIWVAHFGHHRLSGD